MEIKIFEKEEIIKNLALLAQAASDFGYGDLVFCKKIIEGSRVVGAVFLGNEIVGFGRVVGDGVRFGYIVDLNIAESQRKKGIGTDLVRKLAESAKTRYVELTTDPNIQWLKDFYQKAGFKLSKGEYVFEWDDDTEKNKS